jgi:hypothetical protein
MISCIAKAGFARRLEMTKGSVFAVAAVIAASFAATPSLQAEPAAPYDERDERAPVEQRRTSGKGPVAGAVEGTAEGAVETGKGAAKGTGTAARGVVKGAGETGEGVAEGAREVGKGNVVKGAGNAGKGTVKGAAEAARGIARGAGEAGLGAAKRVGCVATLGKSC